MMKKKFPYSVVLIILVLALIVTACGGSSGKEAQGSDGSTEKAENKAEKVYELNFNNFTSSAGAIGQLTEKWKTMVEEKSNGRIKVNLYHNAALGSATTLLKDVKNGVYDVGLLFSMYHQDSDAFPLTVGDLPFAASSDIVKNTKVMNEYYQKYKDIVVKDVVHMGLVTAAPSYIVSSKPIYKYEDLKGKKGKADGKSETYTYKEWGVVPVDVPLEEVYDSLSKGVIDLLLTSPSQARDQHFTEVAPYLVRVPYRVIQVMPIMNKDFYGSLPDDLKALFDNELNQDLLDLIINQNVIDAEKSLKDFAQLVEGRGGIIELSAEDTHLIKSKAKAAWDAWVEDANKRGYPGEQMLNDYKEIAKREGIDLPF